MLLLNSQTLNFHQVVFEGLAGKSFVGDIALDDIKVYDGKCPPTSKTLSVFRANQIHRHSFLTKAHRFEAENNFLSCSCENAILFM